MEPSPDNRTSSYALAYEGVESDRMSILTCVAKPVSLPRAISEQVHISA